MSGEVDLLDRDYGTPGSSYYTGCPAADMRVFRLGERTRFMVCGDPSGSASNFGLYRQAGLGDGTWTAPTLVERGIEDLQVAPRYLDVNGLAATGTGASCGTLGSASTNLCTCEDSLTPSCTVSSAPLSALDTTINGTTPHVALLRGLRIALSGVSQKTRSSGGKTLDSVRPLLFNHDNTGVTPDDLFRRTQRLDIQLDNLDLPP